LIAALGLGDGIVRFVSYYRGENKRENIKYLLKFSLKVTFISSLVMMVILFLSSEVIAQYLFDDILLARFLKFFALIIFIQNSGGIFTAILRAHEKLGWSSFISSVFTPFIQLIALLIFMALGFGSNSPIFSVIIGSFSFLTLGVVVNRVTIPYIFLKLHITKNKKLNIKKEVTRYSLPFLMSSLMLFISTSIDSMLIGFFLGVKNVGIYNSAGPIAQLISLPSGLFSQIFLPLTTREYAQKNIQLVSDISFRIIKWVFILNFIPILLLLLFPHFIINLIFGSQYLDASMALRFLGIGIFFNSFTIIAQSLLAMAGQSKIIFQNSIIFSASIIILDLILIPLYGINGAAFSSMMSSFVLTSLMFFYVKKFLPLHIFTKDFLKIIDTKDINILKSLLVKSKEISKKV